MQTLTRAHDELFRRTPDERFLTLDELYEHTQNQQRWSETVWHQPGELVPTPESGRLDLFVHQSESYRLNNWSFGQICSLARVSRDTINRLSPDTAAKVFAETMPRGDKPLQVYKTGNLVRAVHGASYTRLHNVELLSMVREFATDFVPPHESGQPGTEGGTGLYAGEEDMFVFLIDPTGWIEIDDEAFAPGFFLWNSEVGKRSVGVQSFFAQRCCSNHIVWGCRDVREFSRKHTANVHEAVREIRNIIERLVERRDAHRDQFATVIRKAMSTSLGCEDEDALKLLSKHGITRNLARRSLEVARERGGLTVFAVVDALTRLAQERKNAGDRVEIDAKAARILASVS